MHWRELVHQAFTVALLITGTTEDAEAAVLEGISSVDPADEPRQSLIPRTIVASVEHRKRNTLQKRGHIPTTLARELHAVIDLAPDIRICFVLHTLIGLPGQVCADLLRLEISQIQQRVTAAVLTLSQVKENSLSTARAIPMSLAAQGPG
jgi:hypothetical protein